MSRLSSVTVAILAGGLGKRLRSKVFDRPKVLAEVGSTPFLQRLLDQLNLAGFKLVVLCTGYLGSQIKEKFGNSYKNLNLLYSQEKLPLGTGGALRLALPLLKSKTILVMNGDSFYDINFKEFLEFHLNKKAKVSLAVLNVLDTNRFGKVNLVSNDKVVGFEEKKKGSGPGFINGGIYLLERSIISEIPNNTDISLEKEIFPGWVKKRFYGYKSSGDFIDIGTPQSYAKVEQFFAKSANLKKRFVLLDRDGTIIVEKNYLSDPQHVELIPGVATAMKELKKIGLGLVVVTNQAGIGRGYFNLAILSKIHDRLTELLAQEGVVLDDILFCPHTPEDNCLCRKPKVGLIKEAMKKHNFDPKLSFVIGDKVADIEMGKNIGATTILVKTGYGLEVVKKNPSLADYVADDLPSAVSIIQAKITHVKM